MKNLFVTLAFASSLFSVGTIANASSEASFTQASEMASFVPGRRKPQPKITRGTFCNEVRELVEWQCGGRPTGQGWNPQQYNCWHRATGRGC
ncbi:MAG: hypothetical protein EOP11_14725 [Proteobacteria bacterium]|nr:MAG: hypothetical protein EOP11_14725 [Pseudomonadota bacterium]